ncbi:MAG TPA: hypothetical protein VF203_13845 [Burkholderiales bacterium]
MPVRPSRARASATAPPCALRTGAGILLVAAALNAAAAPSDVALERVDALIASRAWQLARRALESVPAADAAFAEDVERRRLLVYRHLSDIDALAERVAQLPPEASPQFRRWAQEQLIAAALARGDLERAQAVLAQLGQDAPAEATRAWRLRFVRAVIDTGRADEALTALEPLGGDEEIPALRAEILLRAGRDAEAFESVVGLRSPEARLWRLLAAMRLGRYAPGDVVQELSLLVRELKDRPALQRVAWLVRADAARQIGQHARRIHSLEQAFQLGSTPSAFAAASADDLWSAYLALARHVAQEEDLTLGAAALARADAHAEDRPYEARALYAWVAEEAREAGMRALGHARLVAHLRKHGLVRVAQALYLESARFVRDEPPPTEVRHALLEEALGRRDFAVAAQLARDLAEPPADTAPAEWELRRARILLYGGEHGMAVQLLAQLVAAAPFDEAFAARFLQVVFDLQAVGRHAEALELLESIEGRVDNARMHRELLYWQAESAAALQRHADAAQLYLHSARYGGSDGSDPWGHSARFRAAEELVAAGLRADAETLYRELLRETSSPDRRLMIEQRIERLWLAAPSTTTP